MSLGIGIGIGIGRPAATSNYRAATKHPRQSSQAAYSVFDAAQIQTFKEAFNLLDADNDGYITAADLTNSLHSLGQTPTSALLSTLLPPPSQSLNFTHFLTMMSERLSLLDPEPDLMEAFASFDEDDRGTVDANVLREWLGSVGDRMGKDEIDKLLSPPFLDSSNQFHYRSFCETLRVKEDDEGETNRVQEEFESAAGGGRGR